MQKDSSNNSSFDFERICDSSSEELLKLLGTSQKGLNTEEASEKLAQFGENSIIAKRKSSFLKKILAQLTNFFALLLWVASVLSFF